MSIYLLRRSGRDVSQPTARDVMRRMALLGAAAMFVGAGTPAKAGEILLETIEPAFQPVSLSVGGSQPAATFRVIIKNFSTSNTVNRPRFVATSSVTQGAFPGTVVTNVTAEFSKSTNSTCTVTNVAKTSIDCALQSLAPQAQAEFTVTFIAPTDGSRIKLSWQVVFDQGTTPGNSNGDAGESYLELAQVDLNGVKSDVPANLALSFFSGTGMATATDPWVTKVKLPATDTATTATVAENLPQYVTSCAQAGDLTTCNTSTLTIPNATFGTPGTPPLSQFLEITLLRDASTISKSAKLSSAVVYYRQNPDDTMGKAVPSCESRPDLPKPGEPCEDVTQRTQFPKRNTGRTPVEPGYEGDWKFVIYANGNGRYDQ
jgi:hypothetical protein